MKMRPFNIMREPLTGKQAKTQAEYCLEKAGEQIDDVLRKYNCKIDSEGNISCVVITQDSKQVYADLPWRYYDD